MLVLKMRPGERVFVNLSDGQGLIFKLVDLDLSGAKVGFIAPASVKILREKLLGEPSGGAPRPRRTSKQKRKKSG